jgi:hypothetical protein
MLAEIGPVLLTRFACAFWLNCYPYEVQSKLGIPDCFARVGVREDPLWLRSRARPKFDDGWLEENDIGRTLWTLQELSRRVCVAPKRLPTPVATLKNADRNCYLWREIHWVQLKKDIAAGKVHVPLRSLRGRKFGVHFAEPRHCLASDQQAEQSRVAKVRAQEAFWSRMV